VSSLNLSVPLRILYKIVNELGLTCTTVVPGIYQTVGCCFHKAVSKHCARYPMSNKKKFTFEVRLDDMHIFVENWP
jgi:hypothetical protein